MNIYSTQQQCVHTTVHSPFSFALNNASKYFFSYSKCNSCVLTLFSFDFGTIHKIPGIELCSSVVAIQKPQSRQRI